MMDTSEEPLSRQERLLVVWAKLTCAQIEGAGMSAENACRALGETSPAYGEEAFNMLILGLDSETVERYIRTGK